MLDKHKQERLDRTSMLETEHAAATKWPVLLRGTYRSPSCEAKQTGLLLPQDFIPQRTRELAGFFLLFPIRFFFCLKLDRKKIWDRNFQKKKSTAVVSVDGLQTGQTPHPSSVRICISGPKAPHPSSVRMGIGKWA